MELGSLVGLIVVVLAVVGRQVSGRGPPVWVIFLLGALAFVALGLLPLDLAEAAVAQELPLLVFLFSLFVFTVALERSGAIDHLAKWILSTARRPSDIPFVLFVGFGALSALLLNDALVLLAIPLLFAVARQLELPVRPLLLTVAFAVTVGSTLTPLGNPQNLLVALASGMRAPFATFLRYLLLPTAINLLFGGWYVARRYGPALTPAATTPYERPDVALFPPGPWLPRLRRSPVLWTFPGTILILVTTDVTSAIVGGPAVPLYAITTAGALATLALSEGRTHFVRDLDWSVLLLFVGLFVVVAGIVYGGLVTSLESVVPIPRPGAPGSAIGATILSALVGSQLLGNVPWVTLEIPVLHGLGYSAGTPVVWIALAAGSTLAGNATILGAASNLIVAHQAERLGVRLDLKAFVRDGLPLTAFTLLVLVACLWAGV